MSAPSINVLLITCDALRADHVGARRRDGASLTPNLDALAAAGVRFEHAVSQGFRTPISMPSLFTGKYPSRMEWFAIPSPFAMRRQVTGVLPGSEPMLAELLAAGGYRTAGFHSNPLLSRLFGYARGFDVFDDDLFMAEAAAPTWLKRWLYRLPQLFRVMSHLPASRINEKAWAWLDQRPSPFFLWLHYMDTHGPYASRPGARYWRRARQQWLYQKAVSHGDQITAAEQQRLLGAYRKQVRYTDEQLGRLLQSLERSRRLDDTLVVVTADHGEEFGEHGQYSHHGTLSETLLRVPLIVRFPGGRYGGHVVRTPVALVQVVPTILDVIGLQKGGPFDGPSLVPLLEGWPGAALDVILSEAKPAPEYKAAIRRGTWKLIVDRRRDARRLFDLSADPGEQVNRLGERADVAGDLEASLARLMQDLAGGSVATEQGVDAATAERLRDLGYL